MMSAWLWKNGALSALDPAPDSDFAGDVDKQYANRGYQQDVGIEMCYQVLYRADKDKAGGHQISKYRFVVFVEFCASFIETIFIEDMPDWLTFQPYLAAIAQQFEAMERDWKREEEQRRQNAVHNALERSR